MQQLVQDCNSESALAQVSAKLQVFPLHSVLIKKSNLHQKYWEMELLRA